jgi:hypothetical protein
MNILESHRMMLKFCRFVKDQPLETEQRLAMFPTTVVADTVEETKANQVGYQPLDHFGVDAMDPAMMTPEMGIEISRFTTSNEDYA